MPNSVSFTGDQKCFRQRVRQKEREMGQGEEEKTRPDPKVEIQERGEIFFFYRPKVSREEAHSPDDVQRLYIVLRPESGERPVEEKQAPDSGKEGEKSSAEEKQAADDSGKEGEKSSEAVKEDDEEEEGKAVTDGSDEDQLGSKGGHGSQEVNIEEQPLFRFIVMGRKSLPDPSQRSRPYWGFVELVTTKVDDIKAALKGEEYDTATRGHRHKPPARALAEGVYRILRHEAGGRSRKPQTHLVYKLEFPPPDENNDPQESLNVEREGSFVIQIKNPEQGGSSGRFAGLQTKRKSLFPAHLQGQMGPRRFVPADPPDFLNYEGCELLLISASDDVEEELGLELKVEVEAARAEESCSDLLRTFGEVGPTKTLLSGTWV